MTMSKFPKSRARIVSKDQYGVVKTEMFVRFDSISTLWNSCKDYCIKNYVFNEDMIFYTDEECYENFSKSLLDHRQVCLGCLCSDDNVCFYLLCDPIDCMISSIDR